jgi:hypothetical protein
LADLLKPGLILANQFSLTLESRIPECRSELLVKLTISKCLKTVFLRHLTYVIEGEILYFPREENVVDVKWNEVSDAER